MIDFIPETIAMYLGGFIHISKIIHVNFHNYNILMRLQESYTSPNLNGNDTQVFHLF
jgi:hypothetical protein